MRRTHATALAALPAVALFAGCQSTQHAHDHDHQHADAQADLFEPITTLVGDWEMQDPASGDWFVASQFEMTGGGSAVCETMFPGDDMQMTNLYHMDGDEIVITHYCAAGNQPRMTTSSAQHTDAGTVYLFDFDSVSNLLPEHDHYMGNMTLTIAADGSVRQDWRSYDREGNLTEPVTFLLRRAN